MTQCEMCGQDKELVTAAVEGVDLKVCSVCAQYGTVRSQQRYSFSSSRQSVSAPRAEEAVVSTLAALLRRAREKRQLTQEDFAKLLQERESMIVKWESGSFLPEVAVAKKLGRNFIGFDLNKNYIKIAKRRISQINYGA